MAIQGGPRRKPAKGVKCPSCGGKGMVPKVKASMGPVAEFPGPYDDLVALCLRCWKRIMRFTLGLPQLGCRDSQ